MSALGAKIKARREELGMTLEEVGKLVGVGKSTVRKWETGMIVNMRQDKIAALAKALEVSPAFLMGWEELPGGAGIPSGAGIPGTSPVPTFVRRPRLGTIACGAPILAEENIELYDAVPDWVKCDFTLVCKGDSMINARIFDGDIVCIRQQPEVENGEVAAVLIGNEATLKRVRLFDDHIILEPENPMYKPLVFWGDEMKDVRILGKATHFISRVI